MIVPKPIKNKPVSDEKYHVAIDHDITSNSPQSPSPQKFTPQWHHHGLYLDHTNTTQATIQNEYQQH